MKLEMTTNWLPILQPGLYGTNLGYTFEQVQDEYLDYFKTKLCFEFQSIANEIFSEDWFVELFGNITVSNCVLKSPQYYNYENDSIEFDMEIEDIEKVTDVFFYTFEAYAIERFFKWTKANYGSRSGFISFFPYGEDAFNKAILSTEINKEGKYDINRAIAMLIMFSLEESNCALDSYQRDFEDNMAEYCLGNGLCYDEEDED